MMIHLQAADDYLAAANQIMYIRTLMIKSARARVHVWAVRIVQTMNCSSIAAIIHLIS